MKKVNSSVQRRDKKTRKAKQLMKMIAVGLDQSIERLTAESKVAGSIPGARPILKVLK